MNLLQLTYFMEVARTSHMTQAAENLYISQPALSKSIKLLEKEIGTPLFDREGTGITLNSNGEIFHKYAKQILSAMFQAENEIADNNNRHNEVTLSVNAGTQFLPEIITEFRSKHSNIKLNINQEVHSSKGSTNGTDLYIYSSLVPVNSPSSITLLAENCLLGIPSSHPLAGIDVVNPTRLQEETFLTVRQGLPLYNLTHFLCEQGGFNLDTKLQFENRETIFTLMEEGFGISLVPEKTWAPHVNSKKITLRPLSVDCKRYIVLTWDDKKYVTKSTKIMISFLKEYYERV